MREHNRLPDAEGTNDPMELPAVAVSPKCVTVMELAVVFAT